VLLLMVTKNQTTIFPPSRSSLGLLCVGRSQLKPRHPNSPCSVWNSQLSTGLDHQSTEYKEGWVNVRVVVEVGALAVLHARSGPLIIHRSTSDSRR
jgi:hypothetical protein